MLQEHSPASVAGHEVVRDHKIQAIPAEWIHIVGQHHAGILRMEVGGEAYDGRPIVVPAAALPLLQCTWMHAPCNMVHISMRTASLACAETSTALQPQRPRSPQDHNHLYPSHLISAAYHTKTCSEPNLRYREALWAVLLVKVAAQGSLAWPSIVLWHLQYYWSSPWLCTDCGCSPGMCIWGKHAWPHGREVLRAGGAAPAALLFAPGHLLQVTAVRPRDIPKLPPPMPLVDWIVCIQGRQRSAQDRIGHPCADSLAVAQQMQLK